MNKEVFRAFAFLACLGIFFYFFLSLPVSGPTGMAVDDSAEYSDFVEQTAALMPDDDFDEHSKESEVKLKPAESLEADPFIEASSSTIQSFSSGAGISALVSGCPFVINDSSTLSADIAGTGPCVTINGSDIELDCQGNHITWNSGGIGGSAISAVNVSNVSIKNCILVEGSAGGNAGFGVNFTGVNNSFVTNVSASIGSGGGDAIRLGNSKGNVIAENDLNASTDDGIQLQDSSTGNFLENNTIITGDDGILLFNVASESRIVGNSVQSTGDCISVQDSDDVVVDGNIAAPCVDGVFITAASNGTNISSNVLNGTDDGIDVNLGTPAIASQNTTIVGNIVNSSDDGIVIRGNFNWLFDNAVLTAGVDCFSIRGNDTLIQGSNGSACGADGLFITDSSTRVNFTDGVITSAGDDGLDVGSGSVNLLRNNTVVSAGGEGVEICSSCDDISVANNTVSSAGSDGVELGGGERINVTSNILNASDDAVDLFSGSVDAIVMNNSLSGQAGSAIETSSADHRLLAKNNSFSTFGGSTSDCVFVGGSDNISLVENTFVTCGSNGVEWNGVTLNLLIENNTVSNVSNDAFATFTATNDNFSIINNTVLGASDDCVHIASSDGAVIARNDFLVCDQTAIFLVGDVENVSIYNNTLISGNNPLIAGTVLSTDGVAGNQTVNLTIYDNSITELASTGGDGIGLESTVSSLIENNTIFVNGDDGLDFDPVTDYDIVVNNVTVIFAADAGIDFDEAENISVYNSFFNVSGPGFELDSAFNITLKNITLQAEGSWFLTTNALRNGTNSSFENVTLNNSQGSLNILDLFFLPFAVDVDQQNVTIAQNSLFINSTSLPFMNQSANITLRNISLSDPFIVFDGEDDGTFLTCPASRCTFGSRVGTVINFNVTSFTTYSLGDVNLSTTKSGPSTVLASSQIVYTVTISNDGFATAFNLTLKEFFPAGTTFHNATLPIISADTFFVGNLTSNESTTVNITVNVSSALSPGTVLNNTVETFFENSSGGNVSFNTSKLTSIASPGGPPGSGGGGGGLQPFEEVPGYLGLNFTLVGEVWTSQYLKSADSVLVPLGDDVHPISIQSIFINQVKILVGERKLEATLSEGNVRMIDVDHDGFEDVAITVVDVDGGRAQLRFEVIKRESPSLEAPDQAPQDTGPVVDDWDAPGIGQGRPYQAGQQAQSGSLGGLVGGAVSFGDGAKTKLSWIWPFVVFLLMCGLIVAGRRPPEREAQEYHDINRRMKDMKRGLGGRLLP